MKPSTPHLDPESWRQTDVNLRRAVQQWNGQQPALPEGFAHRMRQRMKQEAAATSPTQPVAATAARQRPLRRWLPYAAAILTLVAGTATLPLLIPEPEKIVEETVVTETTAQTMAEAAPEPAVNRQKREPEAAPAVQTVLMAEVEAEASGIIETSDATAMPSTSTPSTTPSTPSSTPSTTLTHQLDEQTSTRKDITQKLRYHELRNKQTDKKFSLLQSISLQTGLSLAGSYHTSLSDEDPQSTTINRIHSDAYYLLAGEGYTYANSVKALNQPATQPDAFNESHHDMPVTLAATISIPLAGHLSLETGLHYEILNSTFNKGIPSDYIYTHQRLQRLSFPVALQAPLLEHHRWQIYGSVGLLLQCPAFVRQEITHFEATTRSTITQHHHSTFSIGSTAGLGVQFNLTEHFSLFAQPSLLWTPLEDDTYTNYHTQHPLSFSLPMGLRWSI